MQPHAIEACCLGASGGRRERLDQLTDILLCGLHRHDARLGVRHRRRPKMRALGGSSFVAEPPYATYEIMRTTCSWTASTSSQYSGMDESS